MGEDNESDVLDHIFDTVGALRILALGVGAYVVGYLGIYVLVQGTLSTRGVPTLLVSDLPEVVRGQAAQALAGVSWPGTETVAGWVFYDALGVPLNFSVQLPGELPGISQTAYSLDLYGQLVTPPLPVPFPIATILLAGAGLGYAYWPGRPDMEGTRLRRTGVVVEAFQAGTQVAVGYFVPAVAGAFLFEWSYSVVRVRPSLLWTVIYAALLVPVVVGGVGGMIGAVVGMVFKGHQPAPRGPDRRGSAVDRAGRAASSGGVNRRQSPDAGDTSGSGSSGGSSASRAGTSGSASPETGSRGSEGRSAGRGTSDPPLSFGDAATYDDFRVTVEEYRTAERVNRAGTDEVLTPDEGVEFLLVHLRVENEGERDRGYPTADHIVVSYKDETVRPTSPDGSDDFVVDGDPLPRYDLGDQRAVGVPRVAPGSTVEGWLLFEAPVRVSPSRPTVRVTVPGSPDANDEPPDPTTLDSKTVHWRVSPD